DLDAAVDRLRHDPARRRAAGACGEQRHARHDRHAAAVLRDQALAELRQELAGRRRVGMVRPVEEGDVESPTTLLHLHYRSVSRCASAPATEDRSLVAKYHLIVWCSPSTNFTCDVQPRSFVASVLSATRFMGPVGISGCNSMRALCPV